MDYQLFHLRNALQVVATVLVLSVMASAHADGTAPAPTVSVAQVVRQHITEWDEFTGRLEAPETVEVRPRVSGFVDAVTFEEGARVKKGDVLFVIDPRPYEVEVRRLEAQLQQARANADRANNEARRGERLKASNAISAELAEARTSAAQQARAEVAALEAALDAAQLDLSFTQVTAPIDGHVSRAEVTAGNLVTAGESVLTTLVSTDRVYAYFEADERAFLKYQELTRQGQRGQASPVYMGLANDSDFPHMGHMDFVDNRVDPQTGTIRGRAVFDNPEGRFTPGLYVRLRLVGSASYDAVLIQDTAVGTDLGRKFVLVLNEDGTVAYRNVELGPQLAGLRIVRSGLEAGERIVVNGLQRVRPGMPVTAETVPMADSETLATLSRMQRRVDAALAASRSLEDNRLTASAARQSR
ncbi:MULTISPECIES: efflux RND transporter periplasmic adaptor subunit [unclassified Halomonas]|uniref:efflux RND transporter periplasmic adaptor subunit n=1 Tax=unclassified Halomonas TaxID=2609666 RepID=UPI0023B80721|nr:MULTISPECIES: efflux RND transporter periplasmic adaptor subunit [unclassified Halomonas]